jgi:hypothetical protein
MTDRLRINRRDLTNILLVGAALWLFLFVSRRMVSAFGLFSPPIHGSGKSGSIASFLALFVGCMVFAVALRLIHWQRNSTSRKEALAIGGVLALVPLAVTFARLDSGVSSASISSALAIVGAIGASLLMRELTVAATNSDSQDLRSKSSNHGA